MDMTPDQTIALWFHYEELAMHFNELIIQYRLQLMGGVGALGALSGYLISSRIDEPLMRHKLRAFVSSGILLIFLAAMHLDVYYYNELLRGAVDALLRFESEHPVVYASTYIKNRFEGGATSKIYITYAILLVPLVLFTAWSWYELWKDRNNG